MHAAGRSEYLTNTVPNVDLRPHPRLLRARWWDPAQCLRTGQPSLAVGWLDQSQVRHRTVLVKGSCGALSAFTTPHRLYPPVFCSRFCCSPHPARRTIGSAQPQGLAFCGPHRALLTHLARGVVNPYRRRFLTRHEVHGDTNRRVCTPAVDRQTLQ